VPITNCHVHTFTHDHVPDRYPSWLVNKLLRIPPLRLVLVWLVLRVAPETQLGRYARILQTSYKRSQEEIFRLVRELYPAGTRFVVLPMDLTYIGAGRPDKSIDEQHRELAREVRDVYPDLVIPFAAVDPRHSDIVERTIHLLQREGFRGMKLYPPNGYHPNDPVLRQLYEFAEQHGVPVLSHCSRRGSQYQGEPTDQMRRDPVTGKRLDLDLKELIERFTEPDAYVPILDAHPNLRLCLAHFGGDEEWVRYLKDPNGRSWPATILELLGKYPNLWTDISYTVFADKKVARRLKDLLANPNVANRVLFGSDFYVVANAKLAEQSWETNVRDVLGEEIFRTIALDNPREYLG
jgi:uncharacterized protein